MPTRHFLTSGRNAYVNRTFVTNPIVSNNNKQNFIREEFPTFFSSLGPLDFITFDSCQKFAVDSRCRAVRCQKLCEVANTQQIVIDRIKGVKDIVVVASSVQLLNKDVATG